LKARSDPNSAANHRLGRPLHYAADGFNLDPHDEARQVKMIRLLLDAGADLHARDKNGATALHRAVRTRGAAAVKCLLNAGADPTVRNEPGSTAFHLAVQNTGRGGSGAPQAKQAQARIIESILATGASPDLKDGRGKSVLDWAANDAIRALLRG
jgi:ankyrin repeat protein